MAAFVVGLLLFLSTAGHSAANYCVCNNGVSDSVLQKNIDYSCANGADCSAIQQNGACFNPNTVRSHCDYAVNSYFQRKQQTQGSCVFQGTATVTPNPPSAASGCVFQSGSSSTTPTTPTMTPPATGGTTPTTTPTMTPTPPNTGNGATTTTPGTTTPPGTSGFTPPGFSLAPAGSALDDNSDGVELLPLSVSTTFVLLVLFSLFLY